MKSRLVSVTGATGFLGTHIVDAFVRAGWRVRAVVRPGRQGPALVGAELRESPLVADLLSAAVAGSDVIVHAAGLTAGSPAALDRTNVEGTRAVVAAANRCGARLVHVSSQAAIGAGTVERPAREDDPPRPVNAYGRSKLASESVLSDLARVPWVILRPSAVYGPGDRQFLPLVRFAERGLFPLLMPSGFAMTLAFVDDVARATVRASEVAVAPQQAFFIGHATPQSAEELLRLLAAHVGRAYRPRRIPGAVARLVARYGDCSRAFGGTPVLDSSRLSELRAPGFVCAVDRARDALAFSAQVSLGEGLATTIAWYRKQRWIGSRGE